MTADPGGRMKRLADDLVNAGKIRAACWREVFAQVPRHVFVPRFTERSTSAAPIGGALARITVDETGRAEGRFPEDGATFIAMRSHATQ
ncbi:MAG: hypothetical protein GEV03_26410 [Streptosporangiales bacterium]|nr:hypothetical protein [Streptosporangiales bacterium]